MKLFYVAPGASASFTSEQAAAIERHMEIIYKDESTDLLAVEGITGPEEKILCLNPLSLNWKVENDVFDRIPNIKAVVLTSTAFTWVDTAYLASKNIPVFNTKGYSTISVAEASILYALMVMRKVPLVIKSGWQYDLGAHRGMELDNKKAGIIGLGEIGRTIAEKLQGFGMDVLYWSRKTRDARFSYTTLEELLKTADVIFLTIAFTDETKKLLPNELLKTMKRTAVFVSIVHDIVDDEFLARMVKEGNLYGVVFETKTAAFNEYEGNVLATPGLAWNTEESIMRGVEIRVRNIVNAAEGNLAERIN